VEQKAKSPPGVAEPQPRLLPQGGALASSLVPQQPTVSQSQHGSVPQQASVPEQAEETAPNRKQAQTVGGAAQPAGGVAGSDQHVHVVGMGEVLDHVRQPEELRRPPVVQFERVTKTFHEGTPKEFTAIRDVSFVVEDLPDKGEFVCVLGPSGCGKSTILRLIAGLQPQHPATRGRVLVMGRPVSRPGADRGMVFQDYTSFDNRTVLDNVTFGLECLGMPRKQRYELGRYWIERVGLNLAKDQYKYPHELSGGMRQRVAIARTLVLRPRIILMDEPFGALDPQTRLNMQDLLVALWREVQATVFFVTHSIEEAVFLGDRVYIMSNSPGTILEELQVEPADRPSHLMQREPKFQETVFYLRDRIAKLERQA
jgi:NitT/TauT family transport system ATP-binding protein